MRACVAAVFLGSLIAACGETIRSSSGAGDGTVMLDAFAHSPDDGGASSDTPSRFPPDTSGGVADLPRSPSDMYPPAADLGKPASDTSPPAADLGKPASGHYTHPLWGATSKLTPAPPLAGNPLIITDLERSPANPNGPARPSGGFSYTHKDGQSIVGKWVSVSSTGKYEAAPGGKVWRVVIDGAGKDVWVNGNRDSAGNPQSIDYGVRFERCRVLRVTGLRVFIKDIRTVNGYWPDGGVGETRVFAFTDMPAGFKIFLEGCDIDMNEGGLREAYRTDAISSSKCGTLNGQGSAVIQNCRIMNVSSDYDGKYGDGTTGPNGGETTHCDMWHFQGDSHFRWVSVEGLEASSKFQGFQMN